MSTSLLEVNNLELHYGPESSRVRAVNDVSLSIHESGRALGIVGESGCGKSSLSLALMRMLDNAVIQYSGSIKMEGEELMTMSDDEFRQQIRWSRISMVPQGSMNALNPVLRLGDQISEPLLYKEGPHKTTKKEAVARTNEVLNMVGLSEDIASRYPHELSGGMKQRALLAMALILDPQIIILDEPTSALDVSVQAQIMNLLKKLKTDFGLAIIFVTHDVALASDICDEISVAYAGKIVETGTAEQILRDPQHPYTKRLLVSVPTIKSPIPPDFIPGSPPNLSDLPSGCHFHPRCENALPICSEKIPPVIAKGTKHLAQCWLLADKPLG